MVHAAALDPYIATVTTLPARPTAQTATEFVERQIGRLREGTGWSFAIAEAASGSACGQIGLWPDRDRPRTAAIGYWLVPGARGKGIAAAALGAITEWAARKRGMLQLELYIEPHNLASNALARICGYAFERREPHSRRAADEAVSMDVYVRTFGARG